jgi:hypothetical protein
MASRNLPRVTDASFDFSALYDPIPRDRMRSFKKSVRADRSGARRVGSVIHSVLLLLVVLVAVATCAVGIAGLIAVSFATTIAPALAVGIVILGAFLVCVVVGCVQLIRRDIRLRTPWANDYRSTLFARANGLIYRRAPGDLQFAGSIFRLGESGVVTELMVVKSGREVFLGNYRRRGSALTELARWRWGFLMVELDGAYPQMVLEARTNVRALRPRVRSTLPRNQVVALAGDYAPFFTLHAPAAFAADAARIFSQELLGLLANRGLVFDIEILGNLLFVYSHTPLDLTSPQLHQRLARIAHVIARDTATPTDAAAGSRMASVS